MADNKKTNDKKDERAELKSNPKEIADVCTLSIPMIISALHQKALAETKVDADGKLLSNSAIEGDAKSPKLKSAGDHIICITGKKPDEMVDKSYAYEKLREYVKWFVGPDLVDNVTYEDVMPLQSKEQQEEKSPDNEQESKQPESKKDAPAQTENKTDVKQLDNKSDDTEQLDNKQNPAKESMEHASGSLLTESGEIMSFSQFLTEAADDEGNNVKNVKNEMKDESSVGYYIAYNLKVNGLKEAKLKDSMVDMAKGLIDSISIKGSGIFGGSSEINLGELRKDIYGLMHIDTTKLADDVQTLLRKRYPKTEVAAYERDGDTLRREMREYQSQLSKDQVSAIQESPYSICIKVKEKDKAKPFLNRQKIADAIRKCISFFKFGSKMRVDKDSVIVIEDYVDKDESERTIAAKRPTYDQLYLAFRNAFKNDSGKEIDKISNLNALNLKTDIDKKLFRPIRTNEKAMDQEENKKSVSMWDEFSKKWSADIKDEDRHPTFNFSYFKKFLSDYESLQKSLSNESIAGFQFLGKHDVAKLLFESLFAGESYDMIFEKADDDLANLYKEIIRLHRDGKLKYPEMHIIDDSGNDSTEEPDSERLRDAMKKGFVEYDAENRKFIVKKQFKKSSSSDGSVEQYSSETTDASNALDKINKLKSEEKLENPDIVVVGDDGSKKTEKMSDEQLEDAVKKGLIKLEDGKLVEVKGQVKADEDNANAVVLYKKNEVATVDSNKEDQPDNSSGGSEIEVEPEDGNSSIEATTLYIYPVKNSKKFEDGMDTDR